MAETLGSLIDKLTIKSIREFYIKRMLGSKRVGFSKYQLKQKLEILRKQKAFLFKEIEEFIISASQGTVVLKDEKLKLYTSSQLINQIGKVNSLSKTIYGLSKKNLELWNLEDEARREGVSLSCIGRIKKHINITNQQRNDLIDKIDELFDQKLKTLKRK